MCSLTTEHEQIRQVSDIKEQSYSNKTENKNTYILTGKRRVLLSVVIIESFQQLAGLLCVYQKPLIFSDIMVILTKKVVSYSLRSIGFEFQCSKFSSKKKLLDVTSIRQGDILSIGNCKYFVRKSQRKKHSEKGHLICLSFVSRENKLLASQEITLNEFAFQPDKIVLVKPCSKNISREESLQHAEQSVGKIMSAHSTSSFESVETSLLSTHCILKKVEKVERGDFVFFIHKGRYYKGVVIRMKHIPSTIEVDAYYFYNNKYIAPKKETIDLDKTDVWHHDYYDIDCIFRERIVHSMNRTINNQETGKEIINFTDILHDIIYGNIDLKRFENLLIHIEENHLEPEVFPRIKNIARWMHQRNCHELPVPLRDKVPVTDIHISPTVIVVSNHTNRLAISRLMRKTVEVSSNKKSFLLPLRANDEYRKTLRELNPLTPNVTLCVLSSTHEGNLTIQDKDILNVIAESDIDNCVFLIRRTEQNVQEEILMHVSEHIMATLGRTSLANNIHPLVFYADEYDVGKRIAFLLEGQINAQIKKHLKTLEAFKDGQTLNGTMQQKEVSNYIQHLKLFNDTLPVKPQQLSFRHKVEVLLHRKKEVEAFSFQDDQLVVYSRNTEVKIDKFISSFITKDERKYIGEIILKTWAGPPKLLPCQLKQGSKIRTTEREDNYGTLGLFVRDTKGNIYFTTCGHVIGNQEEAFTEEKGSSAIGKSAHARRGSSITEEIDVSVVRVNDTILPDCRYGLRNPENRLVEGAVSVACDDEMRNLKLYKWGAKTSLTKGTYKGMICLRKGDNFNNRLLHIEGNDDKKIFAEPGDSGSLICFEATCSPQFSTHSGAFIFVGQCQSGEEYFKEDCFTGLCYNVSDVFNCSIEKLGMLEPMLTPCTDDNVSDESENETNNRCTII